MARRRKVLGIALTVVVVSLAALAIGLSHDSPCRPGPSPSTATQPMKAAVHRCYGEASVVTVETVGRPAIGDSDVLVKVRAASLNPLDWHYVRGTPYLMRLGAGFGAPKDPRIGVDFAGTVEAVGKSVTRFKPGDEVYGARSGAVGEYVTVREDRGIVRKPANLTFEQAAAVPVAAVTALQGLREKGHLQAGQKVLINGASGGVGTFAVQIAKALGGDVTGVCSTKNVELVQSIGANRVIDYTKDDFTKGPERYDLILDNVGNHSLSELRHVLTPNGIAVLVGGGGPNDGNWVGPLITPIKAMLLSPFVRQKLVFFIAEVNQANLTTLNELMEAGKVTPVVDRRYPLSETAEALRYLEAGHARGKVIVTME
jgi:NADPH:quinone reductase-like Zn-dependent oxidoreductase